jgi:hypothetical protein
MATDKKHIAVYLDPTVEAALVEFCEQKGLKSKKGFMYSAGVNAALAAFFGIADIDNILQSSSTIPNPTASNIPAESIDVEVLPGKSEGLSDGETDSLRHELETVQAENQRLHTELSRSEYNYSTLVIIGKQLDKQVEELRSQLEIVQAENEALRTTQPATEFALPEPADALNQLKAMYKGSKANLRDVEILWGMIEK